MKKLILYLAAIAWAVTGFVMSPPRSARLPGIESVESGSHLQPTQENTKGLRIAVTPAGCDDIGSILSSMGWTFTEIQESQLSDYNFLAQFDVVFINCSNTAYDVTDAVVGSLGNFVSGGGSLYASGLAYGYIQKIFPAYILFFDSPQSGDAGSVSADILDPGLASFLNSPTIEILFNAPGWGAIQSVPDAVIVYLAGDFTLNDGTRFTNRPLAVSFAYGGDGSVVYTSYHNEGQATEQEKKLMDYLVFVTATRKLSAALEDSILVTTSGLFAQQELLGSISAGETSPRHAFANPSITELAVGLNWQEGTLRLSVFKPDGSLSTQQEGPPPLVIVIPNAEAGDWSYQVDAIDVPHDNYPYVVQINVPAVVAATPSATPQISAPAIVEATPSASPENPADNDIAPGNQGTMIFIVVGGVLCLALLFAVVLIVVVVMVLKRRSA